MENSSDIDFKLENTEHGKVGVITLQRSKQLNALSHQMVRGLNDTLLNWKTDSTIKRILITSEPGRAFCAGGDIRQILESKHSADPAKFFHDEYNLNYLISQYGSNPSKPYIALLNGITMGGGVGISIHGNYRIATENFLFAMPETGIGFFPDIGASYFLPRLPNHIGYYLGLTGVRIQAPDAKALGLIDYIISSKDLETIRHELIDTPPDGFDVMLSRFDIEEESSELLHHQELINQCFQVASVEEIFDKLQQQATPWSEQTLKLLQQKSPSSLKITLELLRRGLGEPLHECLKMEYRLVNRFIHSHDFEEGVRAAIIDKDNQPSWQPQLLSDVTSERVDGFFQPIENELVLPGILQLC